MTDVIIPIRPDELSENAALEHWREPEPLPSELHPVESFNPDLLPVSFQPWITDIAERMQCPVDFPAVAAMVCLGAAVGRQIGIKPKQYDDWLVVPNLWGGIVGRPSLMKSPALDEPLKMVKRLDIRAKETYNREMQEYRAQVMVSEAMEKQAKTAIAAAAKKGKDAALKAAMDFVQSDEDEAPTRRRYITSDSTVEKIGELLRDNPRGLLNFRDELVGWLQSLDKEGREGSRAFFLESWNGNGAFTFDRIGRGTVELNAACLSVLGGIQPGPLGSYLSAAQRGGAGDDGLVQRLQLTVWPDAPNAWRNVDRWPNTAAKESAWQVFDRLDAIDAQALGAQQDEDDSVAWLRFDQEAQAEFNQWRLELENRLRSEDIHPALESHLAKYRSLVPSLALLIHLADNPSGGAVGVDPLLQACAWAEYLESHAKRLYGQAIEPGIPAAAQLLKRLHQLDSPFKARDIYRKCWRLLDREGTNAALAELCDRDYLQEAQAPSTGRTATVYYINPAVLEER